MGLTLRQIALVAERMEPVVEELQSVLGLEVCFRDDGVAQFGLENALLPVGSQLIEVVAPVAENTTAGRYLARRQGNGGYMVITQCDSSATQDGCLRRAADLGIRTAWQADLHGSQLRQLHPGDTGGTFFEIDWDPAAETEGNWYPAGGRAWTAFVHTDLVSGLLAAEIQSENPAALAQRWGAIAGVEVRQTGNQGAVLELDNARLRFVPALDGRGEGLGGIDLATADKASVLANARARHLAVSGDQIVLGGMRLNLVEI